MRRDRAVLRMLEKTIIRSGTCTPYRCFARRLRRHVENARREARKRGCGSLIGADRAKTIRRIARAGGDRTAMRPIWLVDGEARARCVARVIATTTMSCLTDEQIGPNGVTERDRLNAWFAAYDGAMEAISR